MSDPTPQGRIAGWWGRTCIEDRLALALFLALAILCPLIFRDFGISWDEPSHDAIGRLTIAYYQSGLQDTAARDNFDFQARYGSLFDVLRCLAADVLPFSHFETGHLLGGFVGLLGIVGCWRLSRLLFGPRAALASALLLALTPAYFGHMFINAQDIPFAAGYVWTLLYLVRCLQRAPDIPLGLAVRFSVAFGLTLAVKVGAALFSLYALLAVVALHGLRPEPAGFSGRARLALRSLLRLALPALFIAYPLMLAFWPWAQTKPLANPLHAFVDFTHVPWGGEVLLAGRTYYSWQIPRSYLPIYMAVQLPEIALLLLPIAPFVAAAGLRRMRECRDTDRLVLIGLVALAALLPALMQIALRLLIYGAMRHMLFLLPPLFVLLGPVAARGLDCLLGLGKRLRFAGLGLLAIYGVYHVSLMALLHPYEYVYYNAFVGGLPGAAGRFQLDYWGTANREAIDLLRRYVAAQAGQSLSPRVAACPNLESVRLEMPANFRWSSGQEPADFLVRLSLGDPLPDFLQCARPPGRVIATVSRLGVPLAQVEAMQGD
ncbi:MAG TPA: glycosyltransferase family 39 protein [Candidatus Udaeobacter sp.]|nr:glycosyltransferase family 39 protein [Candidatus Udaeobacter sp.]